MILDEIVLRIENRTISSILRDEFTAPLGIEDLYLGLPRELLPRMTQMANIDPISDARKRTSDAINNGSLATLPMAWISGMATARAAANLMNVLAYEGSYQGHKLFSRETLVKARTPTNAPGEVDRRLLRPIRWGLGYILGDTPDIYGVAPHALAAGHAGGGASVIWGDPERRLAVAFLCNGMLAGGREWDRYRRMGEAIYSTVGK
jgi:CubicO group peptidase (beta-lactamase class C family)